MFFFSGTKIQQNFLTRLQILKNIQSFYDLIIKVMEIEKKCSFSVGDTEIRLRTFKKYISFLLLQAILLM